MTIISLLFTLILIGVGMYVINAVIPMDSKIKVIINAIVVIVVLLWVLESFGLMGTLHRPIRF